MRYRIGGNGWSEEFRLEIDSAGRRWFLVDEAGNEAELEVHTLEAGSVFRIIHQGSTHILSVLPGNRIGEPLRFLLDDAYHELKAEDEIDLLTKTLGGPRAASGAVEVRSIMPGIIKEAFVEAGDPVSSNEPLFILEAMKMENEVRSPVTGTVSRITVAVGDTVSP